MAVAEAGRRLGLDGTYIARSYIEQVDAAATQHLCGLRLMLRKWPRAKYLAGLTVSTADLLTHIYDVDRVSRKQP